MTEPVSPPMSLTPPMPKPAAELTQAERAHEITELRQHPAFFDSVHDPARHQQVVARHSELILAEETTPPVAPPDPGTEVPATPADYRLGLVEIPGADAWPRETVESFTKTAHALGLTDTQARGAAVFAGGMGQTLALALERGDDEDAARVWGSHARALGYSPKQAIALFEWYRDQWEAARSGARRPSTRLDLQTDANWFRKEIS